MRIELIGAPVDSGKKRLGCLMGPDAFRVAGLGHALAELGHEVSDLGNVVCDELEVVTPPHVHLHGFAETLAWTHALSRVAEESASRAMPIFLGGDHALSLGTVTGVARAAAKAGRPQFVLWIDAHADFHNFASTESGNLHGTPLAYVTGQAGFEGFPAVTNPVAEDRVCLLGLRSVDGAEKRAIQSSRAIAHDMRSIDETGIAAPLGAFLDRVEAENGALHVSLDVDFLDPTIAPAVGTTVPGGATFREAHLVMEMLCDSGLVTSLDLVELNPFLDERGKTASLMVDLTGSLMGRRVFDRPTRAYH